MLILLHPSLSRGAVPTMNHGIIAARKSLHLANDDVLRKRLSPTC